LIRIPYFPSVPRENFSPRGGGGSTWKVCYTNQIRTRHRNWRTTSATQLQPSELLVHLNMIRRAKLCIEAGGSHFQHLLW